MKRSIFDFNYTKDDIFELLIGVRDDKMSVGQAKLYMDKIIIDVFKEGLEYGLKQKED